MGKQKSQNLSWFKEQLQREKRARELLQGVAVAASEATTVDEVLQVAVDGICARTEWPVGHVYLRTNESLLEPSRIWHLDAPERFHEFRKLTEVTLLPIGTGLPGRVMADAKPAWIMDVRRDENFPRFQVAREIGIRAGFAFPVLVGKQVLAVLEFFSDQAIEPDEQLLEVMANIGVALGKIVEQKWAETALRESEIRFRSITQSAKDAIITADQQGNIISWNKGAERIFGYSEQEILGKPLTVVIPERFRAAHQQGLRRVAETGESRVIGQTVELAGLRREGQEFPLELSLASWRLGESTYYSGIIRDISDRKQTEEKLRKFADELERRVQEGIDALREAERMAAYGTMVAHVAHEIRHPIFAIQATAYLLKERIQSESNLIPQFKILERETQRMTRLMDDLLEFAKPSTLNVTRVDPDELLREAKEVFLARGEIQTKVEISTNGELRPIMIDRDRLLQVLLNLMMNAQKHAAGITTIRMSAEMEPDTSAHPGHIHFRVHNDGSSISPDFLSRIFEPFVTSGKGTGLGLAIARKMILEHQGSILVESAENTGTTFSILLPSER